MLRLIARRAAREQVPQLVTVFGDAGIGKTRLGAELFEELRAEGWRTVVGRSPPYGHGIAFWALGEILHDAAGMLGRGPGRRGGAGAAGAARRSSAPMMRRSSPRRSWWPCGEPTRARTPRTS